MSSNKLFELLPDLLKEWDFKRNTLNTDAITKGSDRKVWWICGKCESSYDSSPSRRSQGRGCPYCSGQRVNHTNSLATKNPELAKQWHPTKNGDLTPHDVTCSSDKLIWWLDNCGHVYDMKIKDKPRYNCPVCSNRRVLRGFNDFNTIKPEFAKYLVNFTDGYNYLKSANVKLDFKCPKCKNTISVSLNAIHNKIPCSYCAGVKVYEGNSILTKRPELRSEWDCTKNTLKINELSYSSRKKVWWKCKKDHSWQAQVNSRCVQRTNCPYCTNRKVLKGFNDMWTTNPKLAKLLANPEDGYRYGQNSNKKVDWRCGCGGIASNVLITNYKKNKNLCQNCKSTISYPERFMRALLNELSITFESQKTFEWSNRKRYDFYIPSYNMIIEVHGAQHYEATGRDFSNVSGKTYKDEQRNDEYKRKLAIENDIQHYIVIDARQSKLDWIRESVVNSQLNEMFDLSDIDWEKVQGNSLISISNQVLDIWNTSKNFNVKDVAIQLNLNYGTVYNHLNALFESGKIDRNKYKKYIFMLDEDLNIVSKWDNSSDVKFNKLYFSSKEKYYSVINTGNIYNGNYWYNVNEFELKDIIEGGDDD